MQKKYIVTGGSGLLGSELRKHLPTSLFPSHSELDVTHPDTIERYVSNSDMYGVLHAAAFISPPKIDKDPLQAIAVNIIGTANIVSACIKFKKKIIYISTDYVFDGVKGNYSETDAVHPVNKYAWSKLGGEAAVQMSDNHLIIRTSFGPSVFPYEQAYADQWTSRETVDKIAVKIVKLLDKDPTGIVHVGGVRKSVLDYAKALKKDVKGVSRVNAPTYTPHDTSLNTKKYDTIVHKQ